MDLTTAPGLTRVDPCQLGSVIAARRFLVTTLSFACSSTTPAADDTAASEGSTSSAPPSSSSTSGAPTSSDAADDGASAGSAGSSADDGSTGTAPPPQCTGDDDCPSNTHCDLASGTCRCDPDQAMCLQDVPAGHWVELEGTAIQDVFPPPETVPGYPAAVIVAWSGGVYDRDRNRMVVWGGGHGDYSGNEVYVFDLESLAWTRLDEPSADVGGDEATGYYPDGRPRSRHTYDYLVYVPELGAMCSAGGAGLWMSGQINVPNFDCYDFDTLQWSAYAPAPEGNIGGIADYDPVSGSIANVMGPGIRYYVRYDVAGDAWTTHGNGFTNGGLGYQLTGRVHPSARLFVGVGAGAVYTWDIEAVGDIVETTRTPANPPPGFDRGNPGFDYDPELDQLVWWGGDTSLWALDLDGDAWIEHPVAPDNTAVPPPPVDNGTFGRFRYAIGSGVYVLVNRPDDNVFVRRL